jgi:hypothetical protein
MPLIRALRKDNGQQVVIPEHWLNNPVLGAAFKRYAPPTTTTKATTTKATTTTKKEN